MFIVLASAVSCGLVLPHEEKSFVAFMRRSSLLYTGDEYYLRLGVYLTQSRYVRSFNSGGHSFRVAPNKFACLTPSEYRTLLGSRASAGSKTAARRRAADPPASWDWRTQGVVQAVKDQGQCGSCWAFSAVAAQETQWAITNKVLYSLSEQNLVDCVSSFGCGCGSKSGAYDYVIGVQSGHFNSEDSYPYTASEGRCQFNASAGLTTITKYITTTPSDESDLLSAVYADGAAAVSIDSSARSFQLYSGGVYDEPGCSSTMHDHAVLCVGYGAEDTKQYWIVKNSRGNRLGRTGLHPNEQEQEQPVLHRLRPSRPSRCLRSSMKQHFNFAVAHFVQF
jgi:cathepsin L